MNFLFHRHLAVQDLGSEAAGLGAMLPDLWRMADRRMRARASVEPDDSLDAEVADLARGVRHHLVVDEWFHVHPAFVEGEAATRERFADEAVRADRMGLLAHVAWELCLDGALVRRDGAEATVAAVRDAARAHGGRSLAALRRLHRPPFRDDRERVERLDRRLESLLERLSFGDWIPGYAYGSGLVDRLGGVRRRLGLEPFDADDHARLSEAADELLDLASDRLEELEHFSARRA